MKSIDISIIIPNYNGAGYLPDCLQSIKNSIANCRQSQFEIIMVDNNSGDDSLEILTTYFPNNKIILNPANYGFATAINQGISRSKYNYCCLLNNDLIISPDFFSKIISELRPNITGYCATVLNSSGSKIESQGINFNFNGSCLHNNHNQIYLPHLPSFPVWGSSAAVVIYRKSDIQKIGLFDETFFAYIEDVDLSFRLHKNNLYTICVPQAIAYHSGGATSNKLGILRQYYTFRNWIKLIIKNYSAAQLITHLPHILIERLRNFSYLLKSIIKWS